MDDLDLRWCLDRSAAGDPAAWQLLATRFTPLLWAVARSHRLGQSDAADVVQSTWLRLVENLGRIREPDRLGAWLATTCRRECLAVLRRAAGSGPRISRPSSISPTAPRLLSTPTCSFASATRRCGRSSRASMGPAAGCSACCWPTRPRRTRRSAPPSRCRWAASGPPAGAASAGCTSRCWLRTAGRAITTTWLDL